jgi:hypothetical protein
MSVSSWVQDMPKKSLVILQSADDILNPGAIASHVLNRGAADVLWLEGFSHGEVRRMSTRRSHSYQVSTHSLTPIYYSHDSSHQSRVRA